MHHIDHHDRPQPTVSKRQRMSIEDDLQARIVEYFRRYQVWDEFVEESRSRAKLQDRSFAWGQRGSDSPIPLFVDVLQEALLADDSSTKQRDSWVVNIQSTREGVCKAISEHIKQT
jgi:hypothetical protein